ncbi:hypothetical protein L6164_002490 [Bauhinia variegata]|uniref:Uncharacterized protein n=1 Tax=Bauhinia variegata TaxID=167791 RepID=A0ACB9PYZ1_BAUVA|nr:hypothetical protein L6164_002490 [Bauhinia variegata]
MKLAMEERTVIGKRFGDEQSNLLDQFERMSFEAHLNRAMLGRSLSEPGLSRSRSHKHSRLNVANPTTTGIAVGWAPNSMAIPLMSQVKQGHRRGSGFNKVLKKLLKPLLWRKSKARKQVPDPQDPFSWKDFSRSFRF